MSAQFYTVFPLFYLIINSILHRYICSGNCKCSKLFVNCSRQSLEKPKHRWKTKIAFDLGTVSSAQKCISCTQLNTSIYEFYVSEGWGGGGGKTRGWEIGTLCVACVVLMQQEAGKPRDRAKLLNTWPPASVIT